MGLNWTLSSQADVAAAGSTIADAAVLQCDINLVTAASVDGATGVALPALGKNAVVLVKNLDLAASLKVYSNKSTGTIDGVAGSTAFLVAPMQTVMFIATAKDVWQAVRMDSMASNASVAAAGSTIADATLLAAEFNVATAASVDGTTGVKLPAAGGRAMKLYLKNADAAAAVKVYANSAAGFINGTAGDTAYSLAQTKTAMFVNVGADTWHAVLLD